MEGYFRVVIAMLRCIVSGFMGRPVSLSFNTVVGSVNDTQG